MSNVPNHIKILYLAFLKKNYTAEHITNDCWGKCWSDVFNLSCEVTGAWEGYTQALEATRVVLTFINDYMVLQK